MTPVQKARDAHEARIYRADVGLSRLQERLALWQKEQFGEQPITSQALGAAEEVGEGAEVVAEISQLVTDYLRATARSGRVSHAALKQAQRIRGMDNRDVFVESLGDAIADQVIFLLQVCTRVGLDFGVLLHETAELVMARDWRR